MTRALLLLLTAVATSLACDENPVAPTNVVARTWRLVSIQQSGSASITVQDSSRYTLRLEENGRAAVRADCNSCGGSYSLTGSTLNVGPMACTRAFCGEASLDTAFAGALEGSKTVTLGDSEMIIRGNGSTLRFRE